MHERGRLKLEPPGKKLYRATMPNPAPWGFNRSSVADQAASALREAIRSGELREPFPGEHRLAVELRISRPTVRAALARLASEGLLVIKTGHRTRIAARRKFPSSGGHPAACLLCPAPSGTPYFTENPLLLEMHALFASQGIRWEQVTDAKLAGNRPEPRLKQLVAARRNVCWILFAAPEPIQRWFASAGVPALVLGSCVPGLNLPSVDLNYGAVGWHAAGSIVSRGHRDIGLILPATPLPGDVACREGFLRYVTQRMAGVTVTECSLTGNPLQFRAKLNRLLAGTERPTALLSMRPTFTVTLLLHVLGSGLHVPRDVSIVSRDTHPLLESAVPELTRYSSTAMKLATRAVRIAASLLAGGHVPTKPILVMPTYVPGSTLGECDRSI